MVYIKLLQPAQHLRDWHLGFGLLKRDGKLPFGETAIFYGYAPPVRVTQN